MFSAESNNPYYRITDPAGEQKSVAESAEMSWNPGVTVSGAGREAVILEELLPLLGGVRGGLKKWGGYSHPTLAQSPSLNRCKQKRRGSSTARLKEPAFPSLLSPSPPSDADPLI